MDSTKENEAKASVTSSTLISADIQAKLDSIRLLSSLSRVREKELDDGLVYGFKDGRVDLRQLRNADPHSNGSKLVSAICQWIEVLGKKIRTIL